ncbi:hypothetical protein UFOVP97_7 [uncultured Caudovirales phage]|uniref:Uncharacterized protein n=1 Tax=uncultured Caudovirales phage TaxID=2100421 RepID=A0A6J5L024_9CAUD|nr:hypothetical protein UFOVP97_7 [uncultured Caudovirales phage]CAB4134172.1 hypothetical protein UFOVP268_25 [uncultured Caudovirales phage]
MKKIEIEVSDETYQVLQYMAVDEKISIEEIAVDSIKNNDFFACEEIEYERYLACKETKDTCEGYHHHLLEIIELPHQLVDGILGIPNEELEVLETIKKNRTIVSSDLENEML